MPTLLVIDDEPLILKAITLALAGEDITVRTSLTAGEGVHDFKANRPDCVLCDVRLPDQSGLDLLAALQREDAKVPVILMTGHGTADTAIEAMRRGAFEYLLKPIDPDELLTLILRAFEVARLMRVPARVAATEEDPSSDDELFVGKCAAMQEVFKTIGRVAPTTATVLVLGESGTGKELVARAIYHYSRRVSQPFLAINCAAIPETLLESELFGHEKGSFTGADRKRIGKFEQCHGGTLFLDEIGDMTPLTQAKILRVLQDGTFERVGGNTSVKTDVRVIAATSRKLDAMIAAGTFREDLFYRLNISTIKLPPLRDRREDISILVRHFLRRSVREFEMAVTSVAPEAMTALENYPWPGNVRQLQSVVKQALLKAHGPMLAAETLPAEVTGVSTTASSRMPVQSPAASDLTKFVQERLQMGSTNLHAELTDRVERELLTLVLESTQGNLSQCSTILGISRPTLRSKIQHLQLNVEHICSITRQPRPTIQQSHENY
ncbi:sigma-54 dependent transcriptional regulator [soil metagenome]